MTMKAMLWGFKLDGISPVAKLVAICLGNNAHDDVHGEAPIPYICEFACAEPQELLAALEELSESAGVTFERAAGQIRFWLPIEIEPLAPAKPDQRQCSIYVITSTSATKIGISRNKVVRLQNLQSWVPEKLTLVWSAPGPQYSIKRVEAAVHADLSAHRLFGEWFAISPDVAIEAIKKQMRDHGLS